MKVFECTVYDKNCNDGENYESYVAEANDLEEYDDHIKDFGITDEDVHFVFTNGEVETEEFKYVIGSEKK